MGILIFYGHPAGVVGLGPLLRKTGGELEYYDSSVDSASTV
jgi:hypothetical protein